MGLRDWLTSIISPPIELAEATSAAVIGDTQAAIDTQSHFDPLYIPRNKWQRLDLYRKAYEEIAIINQCVESLVLLSNGDLVGAAEDSVVNKETMAILESINFSQVLDKSLRQFFTYGFSADEVVFSSDFREITRVVPIDSRTIYIRKTSNGVISEVLQLPFMLLLGGPVPRRSSTVPTAITLPIDRVMYCARAALGDNIYGTSLLQPLMQSGLAHTLQIMEQSKGIIYRKLAANPMLFVFDPDPRQRMQKATAEKFVADTMATISKRKIDQDIGLAGPWKPQPLYSFSGIDLTKDERFVLEAILSGCGLPPELFGISANSQAQSQTKEKLAIMLDRIGRVRKQREFLINTVLMPHVEATYRLPGARVKFEQPRLLDAKLEAEKFSIWITYVLQLLRMGLIDIDHAATMLELPGVMDRKRAEKFLSTQMEQMQQPNQQPTNEANKANQISEED